MLNETAPEIEPQSFSRGDTTANDYPMAWDETGQGYSEHTDLEDIRAGLEVENIYTTYGKTAFKAYKEYRRGKKEVKIDRQIEITRLQIEATSLYNDGYTQEAARRELAKLVLEDDAMFNHFLNINRLVGETLAKLIAKPALEGKPYTESCHWCHIEFTPTSHNFVHLGGHGDVPCCDSCLKGDPEW